ncbi:hypothetical protein [Salinimonas sediminis]|nr:hypothetical protein [Salinimonas sediminis]
MPGKMSPTDFARASFRPERPVSFCPTSDTGWASDCSKDVTWQDDTTFSDAKTAFQDLFSHKKDQFHALQHVVAAETNLVKKSLIVSVVGLAGAFVLACFCWLIINATMGIALDRADVPLWLTMLILLGINAIGITICVKAVKESYRHISLMPIIRAATGEAGKSQKE